MSGYVRHHRYKELFKYPGSSVWWMFLPNPRGGKALRESTGQRDDVAAHRVYLERVRRDPVDTTAQASRERTLNVALQTRIDWLETNRKTADPTRKKLAEDTVEFYRKKSGTLNRILGPDTLLSELTPKRIREYIAARTEEGIKGTTISKELTALSMAVKLARKDGIVCAPVSDLKPEDFKTTYVPRDRWLTREEYDRLMRWWYANRDAARGAVLDFIVSTGATYPSEVENVTREHVDAKRAWVHLPGTKRETRDREFIVPSDRRDLFERALKHASKTGRLFSAWGNIRRDILVACKKVGILPFCPTDLRRTFAQWLVQAGVPYELAYPLMGHADDRMLKKVYGKRKATDVAGLIEAVLASHPAQPHGAVRGGKRGARGNRTNLKTR